MAFEFDRHPRSLWIVRPLQEAFPFEVSPRAGWAAVAGSYSITSWPSMIAMIRLPDLIQGCCREIFGTSAENSWFNSCLEYKRSQEE